MQTIAKLVEAEAERAEQPVRAQSGTLAVQLVRFSPQLVTAEVDEGAARVEFRIVDGALSWYCSCPEGRSGVFCAHCVATAQSVRTRTDRKDSPGVSSATASVRTVRMAS
ncbi:SWIM zinc finger family protein [Streptosporangium sp. NBC_01755]|uniref:SWIM zinc finger family protein n=1 Tax=unclassified Streptosporangium TaxID=2632669 RepID=UPI002DDB2592|nr:MULTISPECIES: SWIM zinc finger family protein [unclassified Streptosporangium]WSA24794.1 SWIM zinc finger family protein [Streptosporangium sp. NBC_01810]WSC97127.1 SWIM zinc finger family protein [Streptosporangium sp. NBC_01755]